MTEIADVCEIEFVEHVQDHIPMHQHRGHKDAVRPGRLSNRQGRSGQTECGARGLPGFDLDWGKSGNQAGRCHASG